MSRLNDVNLLLLSAFFVIFGNIVNVIDVTSHDSNRSTIYNSFNGRNICLNNGEHIPNADYWI